MKKMEADAMVLGIRDLAVMMMTMQEGWKKDCTKQAGDGGGCVRTDVMSRQF